jgi:ADP-ribose pyrophosphatase YjhB (NUDIX family)
LKPAEAPAATPRYRDVRYCPSCGAPYRAEDFHRDECFFLCAACDFDFYQSPVPSGVAAVGHPGRPDAVLMIRRRTPPGIGLWCLPGGFIKYGEAPMAAAAREVREETGIAVAIGDVLHVGLLDYPYRGRTVCVLELTFVARVEGELPQLGSTTSEASDIDFLPVDDLLAQPHTLAFPEHASVLRAFRATLGR